MPRKPLKPLQKKIQRPEKWIIDFFNRGYMPEKLHRSFDAWCIKFNHQNQAVNIWKEHGNWVVSNYIRKHPGKRPYYWWRINAPRWVNCPDEWYKIFKNELPEPRKLISGKGVSVYEKKGIKPRVSFGIPCDWINFDPGDPPTYESQASYLKRHNLLSKSEERRLKPQDFEPESCLKYIKTNEI